MVAPGLVSDFPALQSLDAIPGNLPLQHSSFVGRRREIAELAALVRETQMITPHRRGWVKTRWRAGVRGGVAGVCDGAWLVELATTTATERRGRCGGGRVRRDPTTGCGSPGHAGHVLPTESRAGGARQLRAPAGCSGRVGASARGRVPATGGALDREGLGIAGERMVAVQSLKLPRSTIGTRC